jgi:hypothetical protein
MTRRACEKIAQNVARRYFGQNLIHNFTVEENGPKMLACYLCNFQNKLPEVVNNRLLGSILFSLGKFILKNTKLLGYFHSRQMTR